MYGALVQDGYIHEVFILFWSKGKLNANGFVAVMILVRYFKWQIIV